MKRLGIILLIFLVLAGLYLYGDREEETHITSVSELNGQNMGCMSGSIFDQLISEVFPDSKIVYYSSRSELLLGLTTGKIAGFISDEPVAMMMVNKNEGVTYFDEAVGEVEYGICFSDEAKDIQEQFNKYLADITESGYIKKLQEKWIQPQGASQKKAEHELSGVNGTIRCVTTPDAAPFSFLSNNTFQGYETELLNDFCNEYGYDLEIDTVSFDALLTSVALNKYDAAFNGIYITEERAKSVNFSAPVYRAKDVVMIKSGTAAGKKSFIDTIKDSFYKNFIEEDRYLILLNGVKITLLISVLSIIFGSILGLLIFVLSLRFPSSAKTFDFIQTTLARLPAAIILMLLFYVVFKKSTLDATIISIIGFSIMFCFTCYGLLKVGVRAIDIGQGEAALAIGYNNWQTLIRVILPQALKVVLDNYLNEMVSLIKNTSIVGYISVNDLTRSSDIIRGRTYDALFPLITVALIYYLLCTLITKVLRIPFERYINKEVHSHHD